MVVLWSFRGRPVVYGFSCWDLVFFVAAMFTLGSMNTLSRETGVLSGQNPQSSSWTTDDLSTTLTTILNSAKQILLRCPYLRDQSNDRINNICHGVAVAPLM